MSPIAEAVRHLEQGDWNAAHGIVQEDESPLGCWAHAIVHLMEGDLGNAGYWYGRAGRPMPDVRWERSPDRENAIAAEIAELRSLT